MDHELAAKSATATMVRRLGDLGALGIDRDDLLQEARLGIWRHADIIARLDGNPARERAMARAGRNAIVDYLRERFGRTPEMRKAKRIVEHHEEPAEQSDHWTQDPQRMVEAMDRWESASRVHVSLQMLATLLGVGYAARDIATFIGVSESRVSQLKTRLGELLEQL